MAGQIVGSIQRLARNLGLEITKARPRTENQTMRWLRRYRVKFVIDVGANKGQSCLFFRSVGFGGKIVAIEPLKGPYRELEKLANNDGNIVSLNVGLGEKRGRSDMFVSGGDAVASSLREMTENVVEHAPEQRVVGRENVDICTLDEVCQSYCPMEGLGFLKLDVQGYEKNVLDGGSYALGRIVGIKVEMSLVENYVGEALICEMMRYLYEMGFRMVDIAPVWRDLDGVEILQVDGVFFRERAWTGPEEVSKGI